VAGHRPLPRRRRLTVARTILVACGLLAGFATGCGSHNAATANTVTVQSVTPSLSAAGDQRLYGRITSLQRAGSRYELRFDPSWFLSGVTANVAQAQDQGTTCRPSTCPPVANDNYVIDEGHRLLTYYIAANTRGTVLGRTATGFQSKTINAAQLARLVGGDSPLKLYEPLSTGVWILVHVDTVRTFAQQYHP
jgi:hypothetical protein